MANIYNYINWSLCIKGFRLSLLTRVLVLDSKSDARNH